MSTFVRDLILLEDAPQFDPIGLGNLQLWLDSADASSITLDGSNNVEQWNDKSGNARHWSEATVLNRPGLTTTFMGSRSAVVFDSSVKRLGTLATYGAIGNNTAKTITSFHVIKWPSSTSRYFFESSVTGHKLFPNYSGMIGYYDGGPESTARINGAVGSQIATGEIVTAQRNGANMILKYGETTVASRSDASGDLAVNLSDTLTILGPASGTANVAEVLIYSSALTEPEMVQVRSYLRAKWGTP